MKCPKCEASNEKDAKFCVECGAELTKKERKTGKAKVESKAKFEPKSLLKLITNPYEAYKENEETLNDTKKCLIFSGIIVAFSTIVKLIVAMYHAIRVTEYSWSTGTTTSWVWSNLGEVNYLGVIGKNILIYAGILAAISGVYYLASLVIKKETSFIKLLGMVNVTIIPYILASLIVGPILGMLSSYIGSGVTTIATILSLICFMELVTEEIQIKDKNKKIYFHLICLSILAIAVNILYTNIVVTEVKSGLDSLSDLFK